MRGRVVIESEWQWIDADRSAGDERPVIEDVDVVSAEPARAPTLGELLRAERERQGVGLDKIEAATRIRAAQLRAIEEDRLDALPAEAYARGFVRAYADQLAIDADAMVRLFNEQWGGQFATDPEPAAPIRPPLVPATARPLGLLSVVLALALLAVSATIFMTRGSERSSPAAQPPPPTSHAPSSAPTSSPPKTTAPAPPAPASVRLTVTATTGACWLEARRGSVAGPLLVERTLAAGEAVRLHGKRIWLRLGDPASVQLRLNGRRLPLAAAANPINLLVSRHGAQPA